YQLKRNTMLERIDHIAVACNDLQKGIEYIEALLGVQSSVGGVHPGFGTKNHLIKLGPRCFLEIIGPDPNRESKDLPSLFMIDQVVEPTLTRWIATSNKLKEVQSKCSDLGIDIGKISPAQRQKPDGSTIQWKLSDPYRLNFDGLMPFFIDWGQTPHPAENLDQPCTLLKLEVYHRNKLEVERIFQNLKLPIPVHFGESTKIVATIDCPKGIVQLT
ncbi:MAG: VOC family protein, partial [Bacteroidia bacterium]|nr:VOC family protein [Bacteroidia bacterium]